MVIAALDERLSSYALIARTAIEVTVPFLTRLYSERFERLNQVNANCLLCIHFFSVYNKAQGNGITFFCFMWLKL